MVTIKELTELDRSKFSGAAGGWAAVSNRGSAAMDRVNREMIAKLQLTQKGRAEKAVRRSLEQLSSNFQYIHAECGLIRAALSGLASELEGPQRKLKEALADAAALKFTVDANGAVKYPATVPYAPNLSGAQPKGVPFATSADPNEGKARAIANRIAAALSEANEIDGRYARALARLKTDGNLGKTDWADVARDTKQIQGATGKYLKESDIPKGKSPKENAAWWGRLSQAQRAEYISVHPASIGALDGLPATARDEANRLVLAEVRGSFEQQLKDLETGPKPKYEHHINPITGLPLQGKENKRQEWENKRKYLQDQLAGMQQIQNRFQTDEEGLPKAYLLGFDAKGFGRAIVANGNPDTAEHTAVYVPGTTARLSNAENDMKKSLALWRQSNAMPGNPSVSTVTWIGYSAPQTARPFEGGHIIPEASSLSYADKAAPQLSKFLDGVRTAQGGPHASHLTVVGHSYGTTAIGDASINGGGLGADDIVAVASPGMLVKHADELDAPKGHVWSEAATWTKDQVPAGGKIVRLGGDNELTPWLSPLNPLTQNVPSDRVFGANIMQTDSDDHGGYWKRGSVSLWNQAAVVTGNYDSVKRD
ncbi:alpha/beta hydrolase [Streptomyces syringium]|uniref:alpha/beta hydrolase n=1 Tax=Streptomyces syringium TaxID=76729 RepID=UPI00341BA7D7